jgi:hypothetical protein
LLAVLEGGMNGQYDAKSLESALAKLRTQSAGRDLLCAVGITSHEADALLQRLDAADSTMTAIRAVHNMEPLPPVVLELIAAYRAPQPAGGGE